ncbi:MAG TPA: choice-of-anchor D domain-containing protein [Candidatus Sulfotelmatobacter sp.]|nr:choice-of-anchor D domain-containing protein [Candidatus Sulfotelmatobacter sp.]
MNRLGSPLRPVYWSLLLLSIISIAGTAAAESEISVSSANFGSVAVGSSLIRPIAVVNEGRSTVTISQATASGSGFKFVGPNLPITLHPRMRANLSVSFTPQAAGAVSGDLTVAYSTPWGSRRGHSRSEIGALSGTGAGAAGYLSSASSMNFGSIAVGSSQTQTLALSNTGGSNLTISAATVTGSGFSVSGLTLPYSLAAGSTANLQVKFSPTNSGTNTASLAIASNAADPSVTVSLSGTANATSGTLAVTPGSISFGSVAVGSSQMQALTLSNTGTAGLTISAATITGSSFTLSGLALPLSLAAGARASLSVTYSPTSPGTSTASLTIASNATDASVAVPLSGTAATTSGTLGVTPGSMSFGSVTIGTSQTQSGSVTASGGGLTLSSVGSSSSAFTVAGLTLPVTLAAGQSVPFTVTFAPTAAGAASANISFIASNSASVSETATGSGASIQHKVDLSWNASTSTSVAGYNVYRSTSATGSYSRINAVLNPSMSYSDSTVQSGQTYYYATTAVDSSGAESTYSNQVQVAIPFP